jgi:hypothetical protein
MPKLDFPAFTGERLKSWKHECESYFRVFRVPPENWVDTATLHFTGNAQPWIENSDLDLTQISWGSLCAVVCDQFGRDEFQKLLRQLFHLKQRGTVAEYVQEFMEMMHALRAHSTAWDPKLFPSRFVDGLKDEIRVVVLVHQPTDLDDAISLALLQEEAWEIWKRREPREPRRYEPAPYSKIGSRSFATVPSPLERPSPASSSSFGNGTAGGGVYRGQARPGSGQRAPSSQDQQSRDNAQELPLIRRPLLRLRREVGA